MQKMGRPFLFSVSDGGKTQGHVFDSIKAL